MCTLGLNLSLSIAVIAPGSRHAWRILFLPIPNASLGRRSPRACTYPGVQQLAMPVYPPWHVLGFLQHWRSTAPHSYPVRCCAPRRSLARAESSPSRMHPLSSCAPVESRCKLQPSSRALSSLACLRRYVPHARRTFFMQPVTAKRDPGTCATRVTFAIALPATPASI